MTAPTPEPVDLAAFAERLAKLAPRVGFFPLVAFLERLTEGTQPIGGEGPAIDEGVRFRHDPSMTFSASDVSALRLVPRTAAEAGTGRGPYFEVTSTFLGLTGSVTPLPFYVAEEIAREYHDEPEGSARRDFLDLFHHRLLSIFFRIRARYRLTGGADGAGMDRWSRRVLALSGLSGTEKRTHLEQWRLLRLAPLLAGRARSARGLEVFMADVLGEHIGGARVFIEEFAGGWADLDATERMRLGQANSRLGEGAVLGSRVFFRAGSFKVHLGPLNEQTYRRFLPGGDLLPRLNEAVGVYVQSPLEYTVQLTLAKDAAVGFRLSRAAPARLGRDTWLTSREAQQKQLHVAKVR